ncbi:MAG TPA: Gfo/Idh/MocA family oxidoreductase [Candidatus Eisenbacteria bacterium]|nr:Gfo/Idh/MocA family oxidoreductase [Candidatus Eisenbacteria bacterium]
MRTLRAGVAGLGHLGTMHARAWQRIEGVELVGGFDPDPAARARAQEALGITMHDSLAALLSGLDLLSIAAPTPAHHDLAKASLARGIATLVEKPMAATPAEGEGILALARAQGAVLAVGQIERMNPAVRAALPHLKHPRFIEAHRLAPPVPRGTDVDVILDLMIHDLDLALLATRSRVVDVQAVGVPVVTPHIDIANARITFESGCVANMTASRISREKIRKIRFFEASEYLSIDCLHRTVEAFALEPAGPENPDAHWLARIRPLAIAVSSDDPLETELRHFTALRADPARSWAESETALEALRVADRVRRQVEHRPVRSEPTGPSVPV